MRKDCDTCLHDEFGETYCNDCYWANGKPPTKWEPAPFWTPDTNADRIRAMSDEELCEFLGEYKFCDICEEGCDACTYSGDCDKRLLDWLKQPVADNVDRCVSCGEIIPEGRQVCPNCERSVTDA